MASTTQQSHPSFPSRPYSNTLHGKLPERNAPGFGASAHPPTRETARTERERQERERAQGGGPVNPNSNPLSAITDEQRDEVNEAFTLFDVNQDSRIDYHEFKVALKALGFDLPKSEILSLLTTHGTPSSSAKASPTPGKLQITLQAFQNIAAGLIAARDPRDEILRAFALFDVDEKGTISIDDLRRVSRELGEGLEEDELQAMIEEFDLEGKGGVSREEFVNICMG
ncbi:Cell division control protein [Lachnellula occidentalis]|uniref:Cell division control protein n=1 Tax=Lachnellula occidentalis TaxID=215460 RepID=A0A8H8S966_9HELO|nr:Cell division control protein [Lachnellula occidentalis]